MPATITFNDILENVATLPIEDQERIVEIVSNRLRDERRAEIAERAREAKANYESGHIRHGAVDDLLKDLSND